MRTVTIARSRAMNIRLRDAMHLDRCHISTLIGVNVAGPRMARRGGGGGGAERTLASNNARRGAHRRSNATARAGYKNKIAETRVEHCARDVIPIFECREIFRSTRKQWHEISLNGSTRRSRSISGCNFLPNGEKSIPLGEFQAGPAAERFANVIGLDAHKLIKQNTIGSISRARAP